MVDKNLVALERAYAADPQTHNFWPFYRGLTRLGMIPCMDLETAIKEKDLFNLVWHCEAKSSALTTISASKDPIPELTPILIDYLNSESHGFNHYAAIALKEFALRHRDEKAFWALIEGLKNPLTVRSCALHLGHLRNIHSVYFLKPLLSSEEEGVRGAAAHALAQIANRESLEALEKILDDPVRYIREIAQRAIRERH